MVTYKDLDDWANQPYRDFVGYWLAARYAVSMFGSEITEHMRAVSKKARPSKAELIEWLLAYYRTAPARVVEQAIWELGRAK